MGQDNGWFNQNCDPSEDSSAGQTEVPSGGGGWDEAHLHS